MSLIKKPNELSFNERITGLIYGQPDCGKTSVALSSPKPVLVDFDKGLYRVDKRHQKDSVQVETYQDFLDFLEEDLSPYSTIVIDTVGKMVDRMGDWLSESNPRLKQADGQLSQKGWGAVKYEFQRVLRNLFSKNKSVIFVSHEREEKNGENIIKRPDISGSSGKDIVKDLDFMAYMYVKNRKRVFDMSKNEDFYTKNALKIESAIEYKQENGVNDFLEKKIFHAYSEKRKSDKILNEKYQELTNRILSKIESLCSLEDCNEYYLKEYKKTEKILSSEQFEEHNFKKRIKELGFSFDKEKNEFTYK